MTYSKILVPFDGSKYSKKALEHAVGLAQNNGIIYLCTIVTAGNVVPPGSLLGMMRDVSHGTLQKRLLSAAITDANKMQAQQMKYCKSRLAWNCQAKNTRQCQQKSIRTC
jgi:nucleotide-binding universal stress UspA family protein